MSRSYSKLISAVGIFKNQNIITDKIDDKIVSGWNYCNKYNISFGNYINIYKNANSFDFWHVFMSQTRHLINEKGVVGANFIGKFENLENDLRMVLNNLGFNKIIHKPFIKNGKVHKNYKEYYADEDDIISKVNTILKEDFENLDYEKID